MPTPIDQTALANRIAETKANPALATYKLYYNEELWYLGLSYISAALEQYTSAAGGTQVISDGIDASADVDTIITLLQSINNKNNYELVLLQDSTGTVFISRLDESTGTFVNISLNGSLYTPVPPVTGAGGSGGGGGGGSGTYIISRVLYDALTNSAGEWGVGDQLERVILSNNTIIWINNTTGLVLTVVPVLSGLTPDAKPSEDTILDFLTAFEAGLSGIVQDAINNATDIDSIVSLLSTISTNSGTQITAADVTNAIDASVDIDTILTRLASLVSGQLTVTDTALAVTNGLDASLDIEDIKNNLASLVTGALTSTDIAIGINAAVDVDTIISSLASLVSGQLTIANTATAVSNGLDASTDIETIKNSLSKISDTSISTTANYQAVSNLGGAFSIGDQLTRTVTSLGAIQWTNDTTHAVLTLAQYPNNSQVQPSDDVIVGNWNTYFSNLGNGNYPFRMYTAPFTPVDVGLGTSSVGTLRIVQASNSPGVTAIGDQAETASAGNPTAVGSLKAVLRGFWQGLIDILGSTSDVAIPATASSTSTIKGLLRYIAQGGGIAGVNSPVNGTITAGGTAQTISIANASRRYIEVINHSNKDLWINFGANAGVNLGIRLEKGSSWSSPANACPLTFVSIWGVDTGLTYCLITA